MTEVSDAMVEAACEATVLGTNQDGSDYHLEPSDARTAITAALAARPKVRVKALDENDYREIHDLAREAKRRFFQGYAPCDIPIQDDFGWWVMKETERRILAALEDEQ